MFNPDPNPVSLIIETAWMVIALAGLLYSLRNLGEANADHEDSRNMTNGRRAVRLIVSGGAVFRNRLRVAVFAVWVLIGLYFLVVDLFEAAAFVPRIGGFTGLIATAIAHVLLAAQEARERDLIERLMFPLPMTPTDQRIVASLEETARNTARIADNTGPSEGSNPNEGET